MKTAVRRMSFAVLIFTFIMGGITLMPKSAASACQYCSTDIFGFPVCRYVGPGGSGYEDCWVCGGCCCQAGDPCSGAGGSDCREVDGNIICEEHQN